MFGRVLRPDEFGARARYGSAAPDPRLDSWVVRYWSVEWDLAAGDTFRAATLDDPFLHLSRELGGISRVRSTGPGVWLTGPESRRRFDVTLSGRGSVIAVAFRTGGTLAFSDGRPADALDRSIPGEDWFPGVTAALRDLPPSAPLAGPGLDRWLLSLDPQPDPAYDRFRAMLTILEDPSVVRLEALAGRAGCDIRTLQRTFRRFAGVGPKWLLVRARVIDAVAALDRGWDGTLAELAASLGWFDQSHFTRDFRAVTGERPAAYQRRAREEASPPG